MTRVAIDSNILIYLAGLVRSDQDRPKVERIQALFEALNGSVSWIAPVQALGETFVVMRRYGEAVADARAFIAEMAESCETPASDVRATMAAVETVTDHHLQYWDALILSVAAEARCTMLLSEDMQHGFTTRGLTIVNPLAEVAHPKLAAVLSGPVADRSI